MPLPDAFKKNAKGKEEEEEVREGEADKDKKMPPFAKKGKKKGKKEHKDTEIIKGGDGSEGVTKMNDPRKKGMPSLDDENNDACSKKMDKKGKDCGCTHKNDALTPQEYLDACDLGIQDRSRIYIRARLDAGTFAAGKGSRKGKKCGNSYIPAQSTCNQGRQDPASVRRGIKTGARVGATVAGVQGISAGMQIAKAGGQGLAGQAVAGATAGLLNAAGGAVSGAIIGAGVQGVRKTARAYGRANENNRAAQRQLATMSQKKGENHVQYAARLGNTIENNQTKVWSKNNEFKNQRQFGKRDSVWADCFSKYDAESALSANAMNLATDKYSKEKRKKHAQGQPRNFIYANTFNT